MYYSSSSGMKPEQQPASESKAFSLPQESGMELLNNCCLHDHVRWCEALHIPAASTMLQKKAARLHQAVAARMPLRYHDLEWAKHLAHLL